MLKRIIRFANEDFCNIAGYSLSEMLGKPHNMVRHKDMPKAAFKIFMGHCSKGEFGLDM